MAIYTISDLHLSLSTDKPMDVFGGKWNNYTQKIKDNWNRVVSENDTVLIGGDISWAMRLEECVADFEFINSLSGSKIIFKGNHDYWWCGIGKMNEFIRSNGFDTIRIVHNDALVVEDALICGTRGWILPSDDSFSEADRRIYEREILRLEMSLCSGEKLIREKKEQINRRICVLHYPPFLKNKMPDSNIAEILAEHNVTECIYGHLHAHALRNAFEGECGGITYILASADYLEFCPRPV